MRLHSLLLFAVLGCFLNDKVFGNVFKRFSFKSLPEEKMTVCEMVKFHGYPCEIVNVTTEDGYILTMQRVPHGVKKGIKTTKQPVFLQHGLIDSAATWTMNQPTQSLTFILADAGYDVWLGNSRGNTYSRKHVNYTTDDDQFWDFSFDEMAKFDLPACINHIVTVTGQNIFYVGHSQGTTIGFIAFSTNLELAKKVKTMFGLAPVATVGHVKGAIKVLSYIEPEIKLLIELLGIKEFLPSTPIVKFIAEAVCGAGHLFENVCENIVFLMAGYDTSNLNVTRLPVYLSHLPAGTSVKDILHFAQMVRSGKFQKYDYGESENMKHYHQSTAPLYNASEVQVPVALFSGTEDWLADPYDVENGLNNTLPHIIYRKVVEAWNHLDFVWGVDAKKEIYDDILHLMRKTMWKEKQVFST